MAATFGLDFGTTNSVATVIGIDPETGQLAPRPLLGPDDRPHPSVVWYSGSEPVVGRAAMDQLSNLGLGVFGDIVRSPKMFLGSPTGIFVGGVTRQAGEISSDVLKYLRADALNRGFRGNTFEAAVFTIPVTMRGQARIELRQAAQQAGIRIHQFVHEPLAALYGYLRPHPNFREEVANLERRLVLVFDWGGGTLDLTLCQMKDGVLTQVFNAGDSGIGGDQFDSRLRQLVRDRHQQQHPDADWSRIQPSAESRLLKACEDAKIALSERASSAILVRDVLTGTGAGNDVRLEITKDELEHAVRDLIVRGLSKIESLLDLAGVNRGAVEFCLATGGMVQMPAIQEGLREIFGLARLRLVSNAATVISEGAAWIAHDDIPLKLAKPLELLHADNTYLQIIDSGTSLPVDGTVIQQRIDMYCVDPSDGFAKFLFARPKWPDRSSHGDERVPYTHLTLPVDRNSPPLRERLKVEVTIDHNLVAELRALSTMRESINEARIHDLEFGIGMNMARAKR
ncbi:MAG TPA: Hsp70 family protein [Chthoniobacterales bacterium]|nr:Hsp70 family protein [Chthoniobacterales bacterium]